MCIIDVLEPLSEFPGRGLYATTKEDFAYIWPSSSCVAASYAPILWTKFLLS